jgi:GPH family glycoside/pentoside/hexuronide:cation symporter/probable glucitol transport protein GutA
VAANLLPAIAYLVGIIPLLIYNLDKPGYMDGVRERLAARAAAQKATPIEEGASAE